MLARFTPNRGAGRHFTMSVDFGDLGKQRFEAESWFDQRHNH
jgi:hypothetical protein